MKTPYVEFVRNPFFLADFYKFAHRLMYPPGTELVYSTWTPRLSRLGFERFVWFGLRSAWDKIAHAFDVGFFQRDIEVVVAEFERFVRHTLGDKNPDASHIRALHALGYLPLRLRALPEGSVVPTRTPVMTVENTIPEFFWLTNFIETYLSCELWLPSTSATMAFEFRKLFDTYELKTTGASGGFAQFQGHDFSFRGMAGLEAAIMSGMGHLTSFVGTDTCPAIVQAEISYGANIEQELVGTSVPASEHSIQCAYNDDVAYFDQLLSVVHPTGIVSIVSDGYDFWDVVTRVVPSLKDKIMLRDGKVVLRPDSGDPVLIICGDPEGKTEAIRKGAIECLWDTFGGTTTATGYKQLDSHIGLIYGDAITYVRAVVICERLMQKGFASTNWVAGIGSYTYQYVTRDTWGLALKSTLVRIAGKEIAIFKDPKTDDGTKKSQKGRVVVLPGAKPFTYTWSDGHTLDEHCPGNLLIDFFKDGQHLNHDTWGAIKQRIRDHIEVSEGV